MDLFYLSALSIKRSEISITIQNAFARKYSSKGIFRVFQTFLQKPLDKITVMSYNNIVVGVWRRLVARYLGVVEAVGSSPVTPTNRNNLSNGCNTPIERLFLYPNIRSGQIPVKSGVTAVFFVDVKHINYPVRCPCLDLIECVSVNIQRCK